VPSEFQTQYPHYANPPTLFLAVQVFAAKLNGNTPYSGTPSRLLGDPAAGRSILAAIYPKLRKHYEWFRRTQVGGNGTLYGRPGSDLNQGYRWRGRTPQHILTSGLDDYPRAQPPHPGDLHVDALCWVGTMAMALKESSAFLGEREDEALFSSHEIDIIHSVDGVHRSEAQRAYCDTRVVNDGHVEKICHKGYISLFPFFTKLMSPDHPHLGAVLDLIRDPEELWSPYGLRSLSVKDEFYGTDENYRRSPVWININ
jgi:mannosyl-oligosaccharide glucosidase